MKAKTKLFKPIIRYTFLSTLAVLLMISCSDDAYFKKMHEPIDQIWTYDDVFLFEPDIEDTSKIFDVFIQVEHLKSYPFQNLYFSFNHLEGEHLDASRDTLNIDLVNKSGYFTGECGSKTCVANFLLYKDFQFKNPGIQKIKIQQLTRLDSLHGIQNVGLILEESQL